MGGGTAAGQPLGPACTDFLFSIGAPGVPLSP